MFLFFVRLNDNDPSIPLLNWSYSVAQGTLTWHLKNVLDDIMVLITTFFFEWAYLLSILYIVFRCGPINDVIPIFCIVMAVSLMISTRIEYFICSRSIAVLGCTEAVE